MNKVELCGYLNAEPVRKCINNRKVVIFQIVVDDEIEGKPARKYAHTVLAWEEVGEEVWNSCGIGDSIRVVGKLTSRPISGQKYLKTEVVASEAGLAFDKKPEGRISSASDAPVARAAVYPAVEPNAACVAAENGNDN
jgi:single-stranded DNA-binding protein